MKLRQIINEFFDILGDNYLVTPKGEFIRVHNHESELIEFLDNLYQIEKNELYRLKQQEATVTDQHGRKLIFWQLSLLGFDKGFIRIKGWDGNTHLEFNQQTASLTALKKIFARLNEFKNPFKVYIDLIINKNNQYTVKDLQFDLPEQRKKFMQQFKEYF